MAGRELVLQSENLRVTVLPELGGKIASLRWLPEGVELLQAPLAPYAGRTMSMGFDESDAGGFDECLPSVAACAIKTSGGVVQVPDHGDFWRIPWDAEAEEEDVIRLAATGLSLPLRFEKTLELHGSTLAIRYRVRNVGQYDVEYAWSAHPLFAVDPGDAVDLPESVDHVTVEGSAGNRLGARHSRHAWPRTVDQRKNGIDLSVAGSPGDGVGDKLFAEAPAEGWAALERVGPGLRIEVRFDPQQCPWLGLWLCYGGWPAGNTRRQQCVAIEPCTAPADSLAEAIAGGWARSLAPEESDEWWVRIGVGRLMLP